MKSKNIESATSDLISLILPISQLFIVFLGENKLLFLDTSVIFSTSIVSFIVSIMIVLLMSTDPYFRKSTNRKKEEEYLTYLNKTDPSIFEKKETSKIPVKTPPLYITYDLISIILIPISLLSGYVFIFLGLAIENSSIFFSLIQAFSYIVFIVSSTAVIFHFMYKKFRLGKWKENRKTRAKRAVDLAISHLSIDSIPAVRIKDSVETRGYPSYFLVKIEVAGDIYTIWTDLEAREFVKSVKNISEKK